MTLEKKKKISYALVQNLFVQESYPADLRLISGLLFLDIVKLRQKLLSLLVDLRGLISKSSKGSKFGDKSLLSVGRGSGEMLILHQKLVLELVLIIYGSENEDGLSDECGLSINKILEEITEKFALRSSTSFCDGVPSNFSSDKFLKSSFNLSAYFLIELG